MCRKTQICIGLPLAVLYGAGVVLLASRGLVPTGNGLIGAGAGFLAYWFSWIPAAFLVLCYVATSLGLGLPGFRGEDLSSITGFLASVVFVVVAASIVAVTHKLRVALERVRVSERKRRLISDNTGDMILAYGIGHEFRYANPAVEKLTGYTVDDLQHTPYGAWIHPEDRERLMALWGEVYGGGAFSDIEFRIVKRSGEPGWLSSTWGPLKDERGVQIGVQGVERDVTRRKQAEGALTQAKQLYEGLVNSLDGIVWAADATTSRFTFVSHQAERILGYPAAQWLNEPAFWAEHLHPEDRESAVEFRLAQTSARKNHSFEYRMLAADGRVVWLHDLVTVSTAADGSALLSGVMVDVTERHRMDEDLKQAHDRALDAVKAKSYFLAAVSHEIRTPMNGILGMTDLLLDTGLTSDQRELTGMVRSSAEALLAIINDILDFSKLEAGKVALQRVDFGLRRAIAGVVELLSEEAARKQIGLVWSVDASVPEDLHGDPGRLRQVLLNLLGNAVKFTDHGEVSLRVGFAGDSPAEIRVRFEITDTGVGIPAEIVETLFQRFSQGEVEPARRCQGTGLGLAISKQLAELMGGQIGVETRLGTGSTFWFTASFERHAALSPNGQGDRRAIPRAVAPGARLLIAEDNAVNQKLLLRVLKKLGYRADAVWNGLEALDALSRIQYDLVLMDCQMPELDGYESSRRLRLSEGSSRRTPVVALTAYAMPGDREKCLEAGMDDFLTKPVDLRSLAETLNHWLAPTPAQASAPTPR